MAIEYTEWAMGAEYVSEEGTGFWQRLREEKGWSREDVERMTDDQVLHERQEMFETRPGMPDLDEIEALAVLYATSPGELIDRCYVQETQRILSEEP